MSRTSIYALLATVLTLALAATASAALTDGLKLLYEFDNAGDLGANSASGSSGTNSGVAHTGSGLIGGASDWAADGAIISVAGSDLPNIEFPDDGGGAGTGDGSRTIAFWVKTTEAARTTFYSTGGIAYGSPFGPNSGVWRSYSLDYTPDNFNQLEAFAFSAPDGGFSAKHNTKDNDAFTLHDDVWHHVAVTMMRSGGTTETTIYADGQLLPAVDVDSANPASTSHPNGYPLVHFTLGTNAEGATNQDLNGLLDDFGIWDRKLSAGEISGIYDEGLQGIGILGATPLPPATEFSWTTTNVGDWADNSNWTFSTGTTPNPDIRANGPDHTAIFGDAISGPTNVSTHAAVTVNRIEFNNTSHSYAVAGLGSVNLAATETPCLACPSVSATGTHQFQAVVNLLNDTSIDVTSGSTLSFNNALELMGSTLTKVGDGTLAINNKLTTAGGTVVVQQGTISGNGTIGGDVDNGSGTISPGNSPGVLTIEGDLTQGEGGSILIELSGTAAGSQYDILQVDGRLSADGTLEVSLLDGFQPSLGDTFNILDFGSLSGGFDEVLLPDLAGTLSWDDSSLLVGGSLSVVPEPTTIIPLSLGLMVWLTCRRRKMIGRV